MVNTKEMLNTKDMVTRELVVKRRSSSFVHFPCEISNEKINSNIEPGVRSSLKFKRKSLNKKLSFKGEAIHVVVAHSIVLCHAFY